MRTLYLCGPINGRTDADAMGWRQQVQKLWKGHTLDPMRRDYRGRELEPGISKEIVDGDIADIDACDAVVAYFDKPSVGTSMEVFYAKHVKKKPVIVIDASDKPLSPWMVHHADHVVRHVSVALACVDMTLNSAERGVK